MIIVLDAAGAAELARAVTVYAKRQRERGYRVSRDLIDLHQALTRATSPPADDVRSDVRVSGHDYPSAGNVPQDRIAVRNAAERLGLSSRHLRRLVAAGEIPAGRDGARVWFRQQDLDDYLDRRTHANHRAESGRAGT